MKERPCCLQHTAADFKVILADLKLANGCLFTALREKSICGVAFCYPDGETLRINELLADNTEIEKAVLAEAAKQWKCDKITLIRPVKQGLEEHHLGMARIIDAKKVLQLFAAAFPQEEMNLELTDDTLAANNGYYYINNGKCMKSEERLPGTHQRLNIEMLTLKIFAPLQPYMSLMLN
jgi:predicted acetyltransferase